MNNLSKVFVFKIAVTIFIWCVPLILFPQFLLDAIGFPEQNSYMFVRMLGWAYVALCVGYGFGLSASLKGKRAMGPIWVGIGSNGGACIYLLYYGISGTWVNWGIFMQVILWGSSLATGLITLGLYLFGVKGKGVVV